MKKILPLIRVAARVTPLLSLAACASSFPLSGAWEGSCTFDAASPVNGETAWDFRLVLAENEWAADNDSVTGWDFYTGTYVVSSGGRDWEGQGLQMGHCNLSAGCGDIHSPLYPSTADTYLDWAVVVDDEPQGYHVVDFRFFGSAERGSMSGDCQQVYAPWSNLDPPAFDIWGSGGGVQVSTSEEPW
ncbi:MAG: hypothetical protein H6741_26030 [Alphaproteobacteria bacterium]|nr:hypothetical protein [Alphaproteobacteria bacterium]